MFNDLRKVSIPKSWKSGDGPSTSDGDKKSNKTMTELFEENMSKIKPVEEPPGLESANTAVAETVVSIVGNPVEETRGGVPGSSSNPSPMRDRFEENMGRHRCHGTQGGS